MVLRANAYAVVYPDVVLPAQQSARVRHLTPERRLMIAVLDDAIQCVMKYRSATDGPGRRQFVEESDWLLSTDDRWPYSFECICDVLNLDAGAVRAGLCLISSAPSGTDASLTCSR
jgi:hypothetical protein